MLVTNDQHVPVCTEVQSVVEVIDTPEIQNSSSIETPEEDLHGQVDQSVLCELKTFGKFSVKNCENDPKMIKYYTGFCDFEQFIFFSTALDLVFLNCPIKQHLWIFWHFRIFCVPHI